MAARDAVLGVFCRRWGVPLIDGGTVRLPRLIGESRALDLILTGRAVAAAEACEMGLVNRLSEPGEALALAQELAAELAALPQTCLRQDRLSVLEQWGLDEEEALASSCAHGLVSLQADALGGATGSPRVPGGTAARARPGGRRGPSRPENMQDPPPHDGEPCRRA